VKFGTGEPTFGPLPRAKFHVYRGNVSPLEGEKPIFGPLNKNNTGMDALRAGLAVINCRPTIFENGSDVVLEAMRWPWRWP